MNPTPTETNGGADVIPDSELTGLGSGSVATGAAAVSGAPGMGLLKRPTLLDGRGDGSSWDEEDTTRRSRRSHPVLRAVLFVALGIFSFLFFLYLTFPYGVIKEVVVSTVTDTLRKAGVPVRVSIGSLRPYWFTGLEVQNVQVTNAADPNANLKIGEARVRLSVLPLLLGKATVNARVTQAGGAMEVRVDMPLLAAARGAQSPSFAKVTFDRFALDPLANHGLAYARGSKDPAMVLVLPLLAKTTAGGSLTGNVVLENSDVMNFTRAKGSVRIDVADAFLHIDDATLKIPKQSFKDAKIDAKFENNAVVLTDVKFKAEDIGVGLIGRVSLPEMQDNPAVADLDFDLSMHGEIEKNLGFILPNMMRCKPLTGGELKAKLTGPVSMMKCD